MALSRKFLTALGIEADKVDEIIEAHAETVNALKAERDEYKTNAEKLTTVEKELKEAQEALASAGSDEMKEKYDALSAEFKTYKADVEAKELLGAKDKAYRAMLKDAGVSEKRIDAIMKVTKLEEIEMDGDKLKDLDGLKDKTKEDWADFIVTENKEGAGTDNPPADDGDADHGASIPLIF